MKLGLSFSRCILDIVENRVDINDVLVVITRTDLDPHDDKIWSGIWAGYCRGSYMNMNMEWGGYDYENKEHEKLFRDVAIELYDSGKMHQPRKFGAHPRRLPYIWLDTILPSEDLDKNPGVKAAWNKFQMLAGLSDVNLDEDHAA